MATAHRVVLTTFLLSLVIIQTGHTNGSTWDWTLIPSTTVASPGATVSYAYTVTNFAVPDGVTIYLKSLSTSAGTGYADMSGPSVPATVAVGQTSAQLSFGTIDLFSNLPTGQTYTVNASLLTTVGSINKSAQISTTPEPSAGVLLLMGAIPVILARRRRGRK